jgi:predicted acyltransferase
MTDPTPSVRPPRLVSLDAYRGFIMLAMASAGFGFVAVSREFSGDPVWQFLAFQFDHVQWTGCAFWDLIQPAFMFMVGVAMPYSYASRKAQGQTERQMLRHAILRAFLLVCLGIFLSSNYSKETNFTFVNVLTQIGLGYVFVFLLIDKGWRLQLLVLASILIGYWLAFAAYPVPADGFDFTSVGVKATDEWFAGWFAHWNKNANFAAMVDVWFLNLFPRAQPFVFNSGGYQTLNFVPSMGTMIIGLMAGELLRGSRAPLDKCRLLIRWGALCLALGVLAGVTVCPIVKRIWTPSWTLFSAGWTLWMLAGFYWVIDLQGYRRWAFPLVVVGMNSIAMYCMSQLMKPWVKRTLQTHFGQDLFQGPYGDLSFCIANLGVLWLICYWLYRQKIFIRI